MESADIEAQDPYRLDNLFCQTKFIPHFSEKVAVFIVGETICWFIALAALVGRDGLAVVVALVMIPLNLAVLGLFARVSGSDPRSFRERETATRLFVLNLGAKQCASLSFLILTVMVAVRTAYFLESPGWLGFLLVLQLCFIGYWIIAFGMADTLSKLRYPALDGNVVRPEVAVAHLQPEIALAQLEPEQAQSGTVEWQRELAERDWLEGPAAH